MPAKTGSSLAGPACPSGLCDEAVECDCDGNPDCWECGGTGEVVPDHCCNCGGSPYCQCWARLQLIDAGIAFHRVTHYLASSDGHTIAAAVDGHPIYLVRE